MMTLRDSILSFKCLEGEPINETLLRFKKLVPQSPTRGLPDNMLQNHEDHVSFVTFKFTKEKMEKDQERDHNIAKIMT